MNPKMMILRRKRKMENGTQQEKEIKSFKNVNK